MLIEALEQGLLDLKVFVLLEHEVENAEAVVEYVLEVHLGELELLLRKQIQNYLYVSFFLQQLNYSSRLLLIAAFNIA